MNVAVTVGGSPGGASVCQPIGKMLCPQGQIGTPNPYPTCGYTCVSGGCPDGAIPFCEEGFSAVQNPFPTCGYTCVLGEGAQDGPVGLSLSGDAEVNENTSYALRMTRDPAQDLNIIYSINWGDGSSVQTLTDAELIATEACNTKDIGCLDVIASGGTVLHTFPGSLSSNQMGANSTSTITVTATRGGSSVASKAVLVKEIGICPPVGRVTCPLTHTAVNNPYPTCGYTCVPNSPICEPGEVLIAGSCVTPSCPSGYSFVPGVGCVGGGGPADEDIVGLECLSDAMLCEDGVTYVGRDPANGCSFYSCPIISGGSEGM